MAGSKKLQKMPTIISYAYINGDGDSSDGDGDGDSDDGVAIRASNLFYLAKNRAGSVCTKAYLASVLVSSAKD